MNKDVHLAALQVSNSKLQAEVARLQHHVEVAQKALRRVRAVNQSLRGMYSTRIQAICREALRVVGGRPDLAVPCVMRLSVDLRIARDALDYSQMIAAQSDAKECQRIVGVCKTAQALIDAAPDPETEGNT